MPGRKAWSGEELIDREGGDRFASTGLLPPLLPGQTRPLPRYEATGSCRLCRQTGQLWGLNQSAPSVYNTARVGKRRNRKCSSLNHLVTQFFEEEKNDILSYFDVDMTST